MDRQRLIDVLPKEKRDTLWCESGWSHYDSNDSVLRGQAKEFGVSQFLKGTFNWLIEVRQREGVENAVLDILDFEDQIEMFNYGWDKNVTWYGRTSECYYKLNP